MTYVYTIYPSDALASRHAPTCSALGLLRRFATILKEPPAGKGLRDHTCLTKGNLR